MSGALNESQFAAKNESYRRDLALLHEEMQREATQNQNHADMAVKVFDFTQKAADLWRGSNIEVRREILDVVCLNRELTDVSLELTWRKVFETFAKQPKTKDGRGDRIYPVLIVAARCDQIQTLNAHRRVG